MANAITIRWDLETLVTKTKDALDKALAEISSQQQEIRQRSMRLGAERQELEDERCV